MLDSLCDQRWDDIDFLFLFEIIMLLAYGYTLHSASQPIFFGYYPKWLID